MKIPLLNLEIKRITQTDDDDPLWRAVTQQPRDLSPTTLQALHQEAYEAYCGNPLAFRIIEILTAYLWGTGPTITSPEPAVQHGLDQWQRKINLPAFGRTLTRELHLYGEVFALHLPAGHITLLDPTSIDEVRTDPMNANKTTAVHQKATTSAPNQSGAWYTVPDQLHHFAINRVSNSSRGRSTLWVLLPWLERYQDWLEDRVTLNRGRSTWLWTVAVHGATPQKLANKRALYAHPPEPGSVLFHADDEEWKAQGLNLEAGDARHDGAALKIMIAAGAGIPIHWLSEVISGTRAVAAEMGGPSLRTFQMLQAEIKDCLRQLIDYELRRQRLPVNPPIDIQFTDLTVSDNLALATAIARLVPALQTAIQNNLLTLDDAREWLRLFAAKENTR